MQLEFVRSLSKALTTVKKSPSSAKSLGIDWDRLYFALKKEGVVNSKEEFWLRMDLKDLESAGAFIPGRHGTLSL